MTKVLKFIKRYRWRLSLAVVAAGVGGVNILAAIHARAMTHYDSAASSRTQAPERLSFFGKAKVLLTGVSVPRPRNLVTPDKLDIAFETHRIPLNSTDSFEAWRILSSTKSNGTVLLFHGYSSAKASLLPTSKIFRSLGYDTVLVDFCGSGGSTGDDTTIGYREADDVAAAVDFVRKQFSPQRVVLYGQSMGAAAVLRAVGVNGVKVDDIILESPFDRLLTTVNHRFEAMHVPAFPMARLLVFWGGVENGYWAFGHNPADYAKGVHCPGLVMTGQHDPRVSPDEAKNVADALAGPRKVFEIFPNAGHLALAESDPDRWRQVVEQFLAR